jgi:pimeloyl-ACP methyl ester carboxylesterase
VRFLDRAAGVRLAYDVSGPDDAPPLVLVHGSWGDRHGWEPVVAELAATPLRVVRYDRRGHTDSTGGGAVARDGEDLAAVIEEVCGGRAHVAGNSFGAAITLRLLAARPELFLHVVAHEPPLVGLIAEDPLLAAVNARMEAVVTILRAGRVEDGAREFVESVALGPGMWPKLPASVRATFVRNAATWLEEIEEPAAFVIDLDALSRVDRPLLLSQGDSSPPFFARVLDRIASAAPSAQRHTFPGAGHIPHQTHPAAYVAKIRSMLTAR